MRYTSISDIGLMRKENQDYVVVTQNDNTLLALVCDGIGGGNAGSVASQMVAEMLKEAFLEKKSFENIEMITEWFSQTIFEINKTAYYESLVVEDYGGMGTTLVALFVLGADAIAYNIGDSRVYRYYDNELGLLSHDQSYAYEMYMRNEISLAEVDSHPKKNVLMNALAIDEKVKYETVFIPKKWDYLLLSSDGLHGFVSHEDIAECFTLDNILEIRNALMAKSLKAGGYDNISIVLVEGDRNDE